MIRGLGLCSYMTKKLKLKILSFNYCLLLYNIKKCKATAEQMTNSHGRLVITPNQTSLQTKHCLNLRTAKQNH